MAGQPESIVGSLSRIDRRHRVFWFLLLAFYAAMLVVTIPSFIRGERDEYFHQHARLVAGAVAGLLLSIGLLTRSAVRTVFFIATWVSLGADIWLAFR